MKEAGPLTLVFQDDVVRIAFGDGAETQLPQAVVQHSKLLLDMQVLALNCLPARVQQQRCSWCSSLVLGLHGCRCSCLARGIHVSLDAIERS
jgi:hypothetical protein